MAIVHHASTASLASVVAIIATDASAIALAIVAGFHSWCDARSISYSIVALAAAIATASIEHARVQ